MHETQHDIRIVLGNISRCCAKPLFAVRYSSGGPVKSCCERCGSLYPIDAFAFGEAVAGLEICCEECGEAMQPTSNVDGLGSYGFRCVCEARKLLADLVPPLPHGGRKMDQQRQVLAPPP